MDGRTNGLTDGRTDGWTDGQAYGMDAWPTGEGMPSGVEAKPNSTAATSRHHHQQRGQA